MDLNSIADLILHARKKKLFGSRPIYELFARTTERDLDDLQVALGVPLTQELRFWLLEVGYGDINEQLSFRRDWINQVRQGPLSGTVSFAQDILGNFYTFSQNGEIFYLCRSSPEYASIAKNLSEFLNKIVDMDYDLEKLIAKLDTVKYSLPE